MRSKSSAATISAAAILLAAIYPEVKFVVTFRQTELFQKIAAIGILALAIVAVVIFLNGSSAVKTVGALALIVHQVGSWVFFGSDTFVKSKLALMGEGCILLFFILMIAAFILQKKRPFRHLSLVFAVLLTAGFILNILADDAPATTFVTSFSALSRPIGGGNFLENLFNHVISPLLLYIAPLVGCISAASMAVRPVANTAAKVFWYVGLVGNILWAAGACVFALMLISLDTFPLFSADGYAALCFWCDAAMTFGALLFPLRYAYIGAEVKDDPSLLRASVVDNLPAAEDPRSLTDEERAARVETLKQYFTDGLISKEIYEEKVKELVLAGDEAENR